MGLRPAGREIEVEELMEQSQAEDLELVQAANAGDEQAFESLYFRYRDWVVAVAFRFTANREMALDVMQETFLYFVKKFPGFELRCQLKSFLYPVVKNLSLTALKKARRYEEGEELFRHLEAPAEGRGEGEEGLRLSLRKLPAGQREVLVLRFLEGMELKEIAEALELPVGTVKSRLHNALAELRSDPKTRGYFE